MHYLICLKFEIHKIHIKILKGAPKIKIKANKNLIKLKKIKS